MKGSFVKLQGNRNPSHYFRLMIGIAITVVNAPPPKGSGFRLRLKAGSVRPSADSGDIEVIVRFGRRLVLDSLGPHLVHHIAAVGNPISPRAKVLTSIALPQNTELTQQFVRTATLQMLDRARNRKVRRDRQQHVDMIPIDRTRMDRHLVRSCRIAQQFATSLADIAAQHLMTISRHPNQMIFAVPDRVAATLVHFHLNNLQRNHLDPRPPKGAGFADPLFGDSK